MTCQHLKIFEQELIDLGIKITFRGKPWSKNCNEWVYFDTIFEDLEGIIERLDLDKNLIKIHSHLGTHDGSEYGLVCQKCHDGIMGRHPKMQQ